MHLFYLHFVMGPIANNSRPFFCVSTISSLIFRVVCDTTTLHSNDVKLLHKPYKTTTLHQSTSYITLFAATPPSYQQVCCFIFFLQFLIVDLFQFLAHGEGFNSHNIPLSVKDLMFMKLSWLKTRLLIHAGAQFLINLH